MTLSGAASFAVTLNKLEASNPKWMLSLQAIRPALKTRRRSRFA
jgi:hypothetical protein